MWRALVLHFAAHVLITLRFQHPFLEAVVVGRLKVNLWARLPNDDDVDAPHDDDPWRPLLRCSSTVIFSLRPRSIGCARSLQDTIST